MDHIDNIHFDLKCIVERAKKHLSHLQIKRLINSDNPICYLEYSVSEAENDLKVFNNTINNSCEQNCTLKDFQGYFKILRQLSQYKN